MADLTIRPSLKFIKAGYALTLLAVLAAVVIHYLYLADKSAIPWLPMAAALLILWPLKRHLARQSVKVTIAGEKLRYETGVFSKSTRIIQLPKVQDVRAVQSLWQRLFDVGDLSIETAGETSRLVVENLDGPRQLAEQIIDLAEHTPPAGVH